MTFAVASSKWCCSFCAEHIKTYIFVNRPVSYCLLISTENTKINKIFARISSAEWHKVEDQHRFKRIHNSSTTKRAVIYFVIKFLLHVVGNWFKLRGESYQATKIYFIFVAFSANLPKMFHHWAKVEFPHRNSIPIENGAEILVPCV